MSNITEEIEKLSGIMSKFGEAHNMLAKTSLSKEEYQPISGLLAKAKVELFNFCNDHEAALQNKVSDISAEEIELEAQRRYAILEKYNNLDGFMKREAFKNGAEWYASIVNEKNENIPADFKQVTGHDSPKEMMAYEKGREDEQDVIMKWIEKWNGGSNSVMGALLKKKFDERKDSGAIEFAEWLRKNNMSHNGFGGWGGGKINVNFYGSKTTDLYKLFQGITT